MKFPAQYSHKNPPQWDRCPSDGISSLAIERPTWNAVNVLARLIKIGNEGDIFINFFQKNKLLGVFVKRGGGVKMKCKHWGLSASRLESWRASSERKLYSFIDRVWQAPKWIGIGSPAALQCKGKCNKSGERLLVIGQKMEEKKRKDIVALIERAGGGLERLSPGSWLIR
jgi:hypothetical protein